MILRLNLVLLCIALLSLADQVRAEQDQTTQAAVQKLQDEVSASPTIVQDLEELTTVIGPRLSGSSGAARAVEWSVSKMQAYGFDSTTKQPVNVPHWERGSTERVTLLRSSNPVELRATALGGSAGTAAIEAEVLEVHSLDEVRTLGSAVRGKIVFYNRPMDSTLVDAFAAYSGAVDQRSSGPNLAASFGAVAALVRSMTTLVDDDHPHTGVTRFRNGVAPIPAAALSTHAADALASELRLRPHTKVRVEMSAQIFPDTSSFNVIGEIKGRSLPNEIVLVGAHLDSWDLAQGAHDDGTGVVQTLEVCRALKKLALIPKRTVRCVLFMSEEFGGIGAGQYAARALQNGEKHVAAVESDRGGFAPDRFDVNGSSAQVQALQSWLPYLQPTGVTGFAVGGAGTDVEPLASQGALTLDFVPVSTHYFDIHHSALDRFDMVNPTDLISGAKALASLVYLFAERDGIGM